MSNDFSAITAVIVEDNIDNMILLRYYIRRFSVKQCYTVESGSELFQLLEQTPDFKPDFIFLDIQIPFEDGYTILEQIRKLAVWKHTRVIAVTAHIMHNDVVKAKQAGFDGFLGKPINPKLIQDQITRIFSGDNVWDVGY
jgi:two-component system, cell cycle response regulator DivK